MIDEMMYRMQDQHQDIWEHFKRCSKCQENPSNPSEVCPEMADLRNSEQELMRVIWQSIKTPVTVQ